MSSCGIIILAAGGSTRMGVAKQSLEFEGRTLLQRAIQTALASKCRPVVVVLGAGARELRNGLGELPITVVENDRWARGIGSSIRCGIGAIAAANVNAAVIFLCDQPLISAAALNYLVNMQLAAGTLITAANYAGVLGTPAVFAASLFDELMSLADGEGGKTIMHRHRDHLHAVEMPEAAVDVDTPADFENLSKKLVP